MKWNLILLFFASTRCLSKRASSLSSWPNATTILILVRACSAYVLDCLKAFSLVLVSRFKIHTIKMVADTKTGIQTIDNRLNSHPTAKDQANAATVIERETIILANFSPVAA